MRWAAALASLSLLASCAPTVKYGSPPRVERLDSLKPGVSNAADVRRALGEPRGRGVAKLSSELGPRAIWFYEYLEAEGTHAAIKMLLVFFNEERYDGHLWFSSAQLMQTGG